MSAPIVEKPGERMPETKIREELEALHLQVQTVRQLRGDGTRTPRRTVPSHLTSSQ
jgi:hypothetical protein